MNNHSRTFDEQGDASNCAPRMRALRGEIGQARCRRLHDTRSDEASGRICASAPSGWRGSRVSPVRPDWRSADGEGGHPRRRALHAAGPHQTDTNLFETLDLMNDGPTNWLEANLVRAPSSAPTRGCTPKAPSSGSGFDRARQRDAVPLNPNAVDQIGPISRPPHARAVPQTFGAYGRDVAGKTRAPGRGFE